MICNNILEAIGDTPMIRINRLNPNPDVNIYAKVEGFNPTGSIKDRIAVAMIEQAEAEGKLYPGKTIIEPTSGNTGIGLAIVGIVKGYKVVIVMSEAVSEERRKIIRSYGGEVILTPADQGTDGAIRLAHKMVDENPDKYYMPDQFSNASNYMAHYKKTAIEIWQQTDGKIDYLVGAIGTSIVSESVRKPPKNCKTLCVPHLAGLLLSPMQKTTVSTGLQSPRKACRFWQDWTNSRKEDLTT